jgi:4-aminobutyrate aminotransferase-like enzyme
MNENELLKRRRQALAPAYELFYDEPVHIVRGEGVWLLDANGRRYLDCYNNVPSVGHCHPRVVEAIATQAGLLNTHTRYLHENVVKLAERLGAKFSEKLSACWLVCTGTEANDLAIQIARTVTGVVSEDSYHGNSDLVLKLSTGSYPAKDRPDWLAAAEAPDTYRGSFRAGSDVGGDEALAERYAARGFESVERLADRGYQPAAMLVDSSWDNNGLFIPPKGYLERAASIVRAAGGLFIADEVQAGYCRFGDAWWGHERYGVVPDIVVLGKPMGGGHPVAAVVSTPEIAAAFGKQIDYFNTFGGNPVSAAAALAVLDVIDEEGGRSTPRAGLRATRERASDHRRCAGLRALLGDRSRQRSRESPADRPGGGEARRQLDLRGWRIDGSHGQPRQCPQDASASSLQTRQRRPGAGGDRCVFEAPCVLSSMASDCRVCPEVIALP